MGVVAGGGSDGDVSSLVVIEGSGSGEFGGITVLISWRWFG